MKKSHAKAQRRKALPRFEDGFLSRRVRTPDKLNQLRNPAALYVFA